MRNFFFHFYFIISSSLPLKKLKKLDTEHQIVINRKAFERVRKKKFEVFRVRDGQIETNAVKKKK